MDILDFKSEAMKREPLIWKCGCGNCSFILYENCTIECSDCGRFHVVKPAEQVLRRWCTSETKDK